MTEFELIGRYFERRALRVDLGIGDDCALLRPAGLAAAAPGSESDHGAVDGGPARGPGFAVSTDMLVAGRHFFEDVAPSDLGHKALAVNLSDLAAMGARPRAFVLALALPEAQADWLAELSAGLFTLADRFDCELIGGDTTRGPLNLCLTVFGDLPVEAALRRDAARSGDDVWVSGELGAAAWAVRRRLAGDPLPDEHPAWARLLRPEPRVALGLGLRGLAHAAVDLSDGLLGDLGHVAARSRVGIEIEWAAVPVAACLSSLAQEERRALALAGGDDYELAFTAPAAHRDRITALGADLGLALSRIGSVVQGGHGVRVRGTHGEELDDAFRAYDHFASAT